LADRILKVGCVRSVRADRGRRTSANDKNNTTIIWRAIAMIKYAVASATMVLNREESRTVTTLEYATQIIMQNIETSDTALRERLGAATKEQSSSPSTRPITC
jgi:hypothetical protein